MKHFQQSLSFSLRRRGTILLCFLTVLLMTQVLYAQSSTNSTRDDEIRLVWSADYGQGEQIYFSSYEKDKWTAPVQLSDSAEMVFHSAISSGDDGRIWAVWTRQDNKRSSLEFTVNNSFKWEQPRLIETGMDSNKEVTILVDHDNIPWIAWTGIVNMYPDIFWSRWNGLGWETPVKAHADNNVPDIHPSLSLDDSGHVVLSWETFTAERYSTVAMMWDGQQWQMTTKEDEKELFNKAGSDRKGMFPIPEFIQDSRKATLYIKGNDGPLSIPLSRF